MRRQSHNGATNTHRKSKSGLVLFYYFKFGLAANQTYLMFVRELLKDCRVQALTGTSMVGLHSSY